MEPIDILPFLSKGITVYCPALERLSNYLIKLEIFYSQYNPLFDWINCNNSELKIWEQTVREDPAGTLFLYQTSNDLAAGFYSIRVTVLSDQQPKVGQLTIGLIQPTPYLAIGIPYSMYPPITLI